jgi:hypothetical protein
MLQHRVAFHSLELFVRKWQLPGVSRDIDPWNREQVEIHIPPPTYRFQRPRGKSNGSAGFITNGGGGSNIRPSLSAKRPEFLLR